MISDVGNVEIAGVVNNLENYNVLNSSKKGFFGRIGDTLNGFHDFLTFNRPILKLEQIPRNEA